jgi:hypothetical protein
VLFGVSILTWPAMTLGKPSDEKDTRCCIPYRRKKERKNREERK